MDGTLSSKKEHWMKSDGKAVKTVTPCSLASFSVSLRKVVEELIFLEGSGIMYNIINAGEESLTIFVDKRKLSKRSEGSDPSTNSSSVTLETLHQLAASYFIDRDSTLRRLHHIQIASTAIKSCLAFSTLRGHCPPCYPVPSIWERLALGESLKCSRGVFPALLPTLCPVRAESRSALPVSPTALCVGGASGRISFSSAVLHLASRALYPCAPATGQQTDNIAEPRPVAGARWEHREDTSDGSETWGLPAVLPGSPETILEDKTSSESKVAAIVPENPPSPLTLAVT
ncbi:hypothetical protein CB1_000133005 [Camelus ferus]|nr:hypothetical protein CB1_000133005 [Camelus ferus]